MCRATYGRRGEIYGAPGTRVPPLVPLTQQERRACAARLSICYNDIAVLNDSNLYRSSTTKSRRELAIDVASSRLKRLQLVLSG